MTCISAARLPMRSITTGMISGILHDFGGPQSGANPENCPGFPVGVTGYSFDLDKARAELKLAKSVPDQVYQIAFSSGQVTLQQQAEVLQNGLRQLGIKTELKVLPWASLQPLFRSAETSPDFFSTIIRTYYPDPHNWIGEKCTDRRMGHVQVRRLLQKPRG